MENKNKNVHQINIENLDEEEEANAAESIMISLNDIPIEIDEHIHDVRQNGMSKFTPDNGKTFKKNKPEYVIRLDPDDSVGEFKSEDEFIGRSNTNLPLPQDMRLLDDVKSVNHQQYEDLKNEIYIESAMKDLEKQMMNSSK